MDVPEDLKYMQAELQEKMDRLRERKLQREAEQRADEEELARLERQHKSIRDLLLKESRRGCCSICHHKYTDASGHKPAVPVRHAPRNGLGDAVTHVFCRQCILQTRLRPENREESFKCPVCMQVVSESVASMGIIYSDDLSGTSLGKRERDGEAEADDGWEDTLLGLIDTAKHPVKVIDVIEVYCRHSAFPGDAWLLRCLQRLTRLAGANRACPGLSGGARRAVCASGSAEVCAEWCRLMPLMEGLGVRESVGALVGFMRRFEESEEVQATACEALAELPEDEVLADEDMSKECVRVVTCALKAHERAPAVRGHAVAALRRLMTGGAGGGGGDWCLEMLRENFLGRGGGCPELRSLCLCELWGLAREGAEPGRVLGQEGMVGMVLGSMGKADEETQSAGLLLLAKLVEHDAANGRRILQARVPGAEPGKEAGGVGVITRALTVQKLSPEVCITGSELLRVLRCDLQNVPDRGKAGETEWDAAVAAVQEAMRHHEYKKAVRAAGRWAGGVL